MRIAVATDHAGLPLKGPIIERLRALGEMASGVAHDFNNVLAAILGRAQLLLQELSDPKLRHWVEVVERAATDGALTVRRLQDFTRIRRDELIRTRQRQSSVPRDSSPAALATFATKSPQDARLYAWNELLGRWGDRVLHDDLAGAELDLARAAAIGTTLAKSGGDGTLSEAVGSIAAAGKDRARARDIEVAFIEGGIVALANGVDAGEQVITDGALYLEDGERVARSTRL